MRQSVLMPHSSVGSSIWPKSLPHSILLMQRRRRRHFKLAISVWNALVAFIIEWLCRSADRRTMSWDGMQCTHCRDYVSLANPLDLPPILAPQQGSIWMQDENDFGAIPHHVARSILIRASPAATKSCKCIFYIFISLKPARRTLVQLSRNFMHLHWTRRQIIDTSFN